jgi:hypothetical protein
LPANDRRGNDLYLRYEQTEIEWPSSASRQAAASWCIHQWPNNKNHLQQVSWCSSKTSSSDFRDDRNIILHIKTIQLTPARSTIATRGGMCVPMNISECLLKKGQQSLEFWLQTHRSITIRNHHPGTITLVLEGQWIAGGRAANRAHPPTPEEAFSVDGRVGFMVGSGYRNRRRLDSRDVFGCFRASCILKADQVNIT